MLKRKIAQAFRGTRWCGGQFQGREKEGKLNDRVMLSAITNPDVLEYWLAVIKKSHVPLEGVYSVAMMGQILLRQLNLKSSNTLLLTQQHSSLLRQTFLNENNLKLSRLTNIPVVNIDGGRGAFSKEIDRQLRYLNRIGVLPYGQSVDIYIVSKDELMGLFIEGQTESDLVRYHLLDINQVAEKVGLKEGLKAGRCEPLYAHLLTLMRPAMNYASRDDCRYFLMKKAKSWLIYSGLFIAMAGLVWAGNNLLNADTTYDRTLLDQAQAEQVMVRYQKQMETMPELPLKPIDMQFAVETTKKLEGDKKQPKHAFLVISECLSGYKNIQINEIIWHSERERKPYEEEGESESKQFQQIILKGYLSEFSGDYQDAFHKIDDFISRLKNHDDVQSAQPLVMPLNTDSASPLEGEEFYKKAIIDPEFEVLILLKEPSGEL